MKRFFHLMIVAIVALTACCACSKVNDIDKRLGVLESIVSDLKAQISAGAVITSVDKTSDGCTFTLSNGQTYTVTNGKDGADGTDGEAIIADVKIEEDFVVLTLKNGETLRISYQNPLSMVTLDIVPDFDDGTVKEPKTSEAMGMKSTNFYLDISVTPAKYAEILSDTERFIHKAVFSPVQTRSGFGNAFTLSPKRVTYCEGAPIPFLQASFELDDESAAVLQNTPYTVSYSIEDKDRVHGAATAFVTISHEKGSVPDVPTDGIQVTLIQPDEPLPGVFTVADPDGVPDSGDETKVQFSKGNLASHPSGIGEWGIFQNQYDCMNTVYDSSNDIVSLYEYGDTSPAGPLGSGVTHSDDFDERYDFGRIAFPNQGYRMLSAQEWCYLMGLKYDWEWSSEMDESNPRSNLFRTGVEVMGRKCVVLYPDNYCGNKDETFTTKSDYLDATEAGIVFLPFAGYASPSTNKDEKVSRVGQQGYYWSNQNAGVNHVYMIYFFPYSYLNYVTGTDVRNYYSVRLVKDYHSEN